MTTTKRKPAEKKSATSDLTFALGIITRTQEAVEATEERAAQAEKFEIAVSSELPISRYDWMSGRKVRDVLDHSDASVILKRFESGTAPLLLHHDDHDQIGVIDRAWIGEDRVLRAEVRFSQSARAQEIRQDVIDGIRKSVSVGALVYKRVVMEQDEKLGDLRRATSWEPVEASLVPIPADPTVGVGRSHEGGGIDLPSELEEGDAMKKRVIEGRAVVEVDESDSRPAATEAEIRALQGNARDRNDELAQISKMCRAYNVDLDEQWVRRDLTPDQVASEILRALATKGAAQPGSEAIADLSKREAERYSYADAIAMAAGLKKRDGVVAEVDKFIRNTLPSDFVVRGTRENSIFVPVRLRNGDVREVRTMGTNAPGAGQETVFDTPGDLIDFYRNVAMVAKLGATILTGLSGNLIFPVLTQGAQATWMGERPPSPVGAQDLGFGLATTSPRTLMGKTAFSRQMLVQAPSGNIDIDALVKRELGTAHGLARDYAAIAGTGIDGSPKGLQYLDDVHEQDFSTFGFDELVDAVGLIADANAPTDGIAYLMTPIAASTLKHTLVASSAGSDMIWTGKITDGEVAGYRAVATNQVPKTLGGGGDEHGVYGGIWQELYLPSWGAFELVVDNYTLLDSALIRVVSFEMADVFCRHPEAFFRGVPGPTFGA